MGRSAAAGDVTGCAAYLTIPSHGKITTALKQNPMIGVATASIPARFHDRDAIRKHASAREQYRAASKLPVRVMSPANVPVSSQLRRSNSEAHNNQGSSAAASNIPNCELCAAKNPPQA